VKTASLVWKIAAATAFVVAAIFFAGNTPQRIVAVGAALVVIFIILRDVIMRVRLAADSSGVTVVTGFSRRHVPWAEVEQVKIDVQRRWGIRSELLEIDAGTHMYFFSAAELNAPLEKVVEELGQIKTKQ
jgi:hypothetical protein